MKSTVYLHPEWKRLLDALYSKLEPDQFYSYQELGQLAGVDIQSTRGRHQFLRFAREVLVRLQLHLENVRAQGYRVVMANEHAECSHRQFRMARRKVQRAGSIAGNTRIGLLSDGEHRLLVNTISRLSRLSTTMQDVDRGMQKDLKQFPAPAPHRLLASKPVG
jgi:hypothetical protein